jgi:hypothetical protein
MTGPDLSLNKPRGAESNVRFRTELVGNYHYLISGVQYEKANHHHSLRAVP